MTARTYEPGEFSCPECPATFKSERGRASHSKVHNKPLPCPICNKPQRYLGPHIAKAHQDDPLVALERGFSAVLEEVRALRAENAQLRAKIMEP